MHGFGLSYFGECLSLDAPHCKLFPHLVKKVNSSEAIKLWFGQNPLLLNRQERKQSNERSIASSSYLVTQRGTGLVLTSHP